MNYKTCPTTPLKAPEQCSKSEPEMEHLTLVAFLQPVFNVRFWL